MKRPGKAYYMISAVAQKYNIHPQTLRLYEREGLLKPSRTDGNTRLYSEEDLEQLETILSLTRDLGVNLAGVEIILNMRRKTELMQKEVNEFMEYVKRELARGLDDWEQRLSTALVKSSPTDLVRTTPPATVGARRAHPQVTRSIESLAHAGVVAGADTSDLRQPGYVRVPDGGHQAGAGGAHRPVDSFARRTGREEVGRHVGGGRGRARAADGEDD